MYFASSCGSSRAGDFFGAELSFNAIVGESGSIHTYR